MTRFLFETFSGPDMYVAILVGAGHGQCCGHRRRWSTNVLLSKYLAVVLVALGRQAAWWPGASHDVHRRINLGSHAVPYSVTLEDFLRRFKTCKTHLQLSELSGSRRKTQHTRHNFVASSSSALLLTDMCRSTVGPGTREDFGRLISARRSPWRMPPRVC